MMRFDARSLAARVRTIIVIAAIVGAAVLLPRLAAQDRAGPPHRTFTVGGIPSTLYLPGTTNDERSFDPPAAGERPPVVVVAHGFAADQRAMGRLARSLAAAGYAALTFDFDGHGGNRRPFRGGGEELTADLRTVLDWLETTNLVDARRVAVLGDSMGANAVVDFASHDKRPLAVVAISGGGPTEGPLRPRNVLFLVASGDPSRIMQRVNVAVDRLAGGTGSSGRTFGDSARGTAARSEVIPRTNHLSILDSDQAFSAVVNWLDPLLGMRRVGNANLAFGGRQGTALLYLLCALVLLFAVARCVSRLAPAEPRPSRGAGGGVLLVLAALLVAVPLAAGGPIIPMPLVVSDSVVSMLVVAAAVLLGSRLVHAQGALRRIPPGYFGPVRLLPPGAAAAILPGALTLLAAYALISPVGVVFHRLTLTPERLAVGSIGAALTFPFWLSFEALVRRGRTIAAACLGLVGRIGVAAAIVVAAALGLMPPVTLLILPVLLAGFVLLELLATVLYAAGGSWVLIALVETGLLGWVAAVTMPITV